MLKNRICLAAAAALSVLASVSCNPEEFAEENLKNEEISLSLKGETLLRYNSEKWQIGYNAAKNTFRIHDDTMGQYFILECAESPAHEGQVLQADLTYTSSNSVRQESLSLEIQKIDASGKVWLWNKSRKYGLVVRIL